MNNKSKNKHAPSIKKVFALLLCLSFSSLTLSSDLVDVYKNGPIKLIPDPEFGKSTNWDALFFHLDKDKLAKTGKSLAIAEDGTIFVSNRSFYNIYKFDKNGNFLNKFGKEGTGEGEFRWRPGRVSIFKNEYIAVSIYHGWIHLFDLGGKFIKRLRMDYLLSDCIALGDDKLGILGSVPYSGARFKKLIAVKDMNSENENILAYHFKPYPQLRTSCEIKVGDKPFTLYLTPAFSRETGFIKRLQNGNFISGYSNRSEITVYSPGGNELYRFPLKINAIEVTEEIKKEFYETFNRTSRSTKRWIQSVAKRDQKENVEEIDKIDIGNLEIDFPKYMPYFYNLLVDSEGNILVFPYTDDKDIFPFQVYSPEGKYICDSAIDPGEYEIKINSTLVFSKGNIYAIVISKIEKEIHQKLIKVKLSNPN